ncbi:Single-stranded DNA-binding protein 2 [Nocardioides dokdonensis FR1436]|uniref:Single-stranded DNA-binding protein n=1 Tax=Nocardioides dokdonensis FR1436 TaxID=1300347 RepID=A0A1A9GJ93_9ACTN|nr:single-stranded DNA-binding protein [Nocardioides dokdonensis]ANH37683.1 Single-stranded DNA-binding protein 2 [Nocardioides dokdonensis FR1436]
MAGETVITVVGNLVDDPELRFTPSGAAVANFRIASTPRTLNRQTNEWEDGEALFLACSIWRQAAENVAESLQKGMRVVVQGRLKARSYETREGEKRTVMELEVDEVGPSLRYATAKVARTTRQGGGGGGYSGGGQGGGQGGGYGGGQPAQGGGQGAAAPANDPWASPAPQQGGQQAAPQGGGGYGGAQSRPAPSQGNDPWGAPGVGEEPPF